MNCNLSRCNFRYRAMKLQKNISSSSREPCTELNASRSKLSGADHDVVHRVPRSYFQQLLRVPCRKRCCWARWKNRLFQLRRCTVVGGGKYNYFEMCVRCRFFFFFFFSFFFFIAMKLDYNDHEYSELISKIINEIFIYTYPYITVHFYNELCDYICINFRKFERYR